MSDSVKFWGIVLRPDVPRGLLIDKACRLCVTHVTLDPKASADARCSVIVTEFKRRKRQLPMTLCTLAVAGRDHRKLQLGLSNQHVEISVTGTVAVHLSGYKLELPSDPESTSSESDDWSDDSDENSDSDDADEAQQGSLSELLAENIGSDASESTDSDFHG